MPATYVTGIFTQLTDFSHSLQGDLFAFGGEGGMTRAAPSPYGSPSLREDDLRRLRRLVEPHHSDIEGSNGSLEATNEKRPHKGTFLRLAEREGFEPSIGY